MSRKIKRWFVKRMRASETLVTREQPAKVEGEPNSQTTSSPSMLLCRQSRGALIAANRMADRLLGDLVVCEANISGTVCGRLVDEHLPARLRRRYDAWLP